MTGRIGGTRSLAFEAPAKAPVVSPLIVYANLRRDHKLIGTLCKDLGHDESQLPGDLRVILGALRRMTEGVEALIAVEEGDAPQRPDIRNPGVSHVG